MRNFEFYAAGNKNAVVRRYALRGVVDGYGGYSPGNLLKAQYRVYEEWLACVNKIAPNPGMVGCSFYEWMLREADSAFAVKPGDLVKCKRAYCIVKDRTDPSWCRSWAVVAGAVQQVDRPQPFCTIVLEFPDGHEVRCDATDPCLEPADIPPEVFALACGRARECPMLKEGGAA